MQSVLSDCPHREKLGWLEQSHLAGPSILYNYAAERLYAKIADDIRDPQLPTAWCPTSPPSSPSSAGASAIPRNGQRLRAQPLDRLHPHRRSPHPRRALHRSQALRRLSRLQGRVRHPRYGLGDWCDIGPKSPGVSQLTGFGITATGIYYSDLLTLRKIALLLGESADAAKFQADAERVREAFNARFFSAAEAKYDRGSQTSSAMPLVLGLVPRSTRARLLDRLVNNVREHSNRTTAGDIGYHFVIRR